MQDGMLVPWRMGIAAGLIALGAAVAGGRSTGEVIGAAIAIGSIVYMVFVLLASYWYGRDAAGGQVDTAPPPSTKRVSLPRPDVPDEPEATASDITRFEAQYLLPNNRMRIGNQVIDIPAYVDTEHMVMVAEERERGRMPNVSPNSLHDIGISRHGGDSAPAKLLVYFLEQIGAIEDMGERRPYEWTERGKRLFPSPLPQNGINTYSEPVASVRATARPRPRPSDWYSDWQ